MVNVKPVKITNGLLISATKPVPVIVKIRPVYRVMEHVIKAALMVNTESLVTTNALLIVRKKHVHKLQGSVMEDVKMIISCQLVMPVVQQTV